jgi:tRNA 5-methylaminomethyl-2-thiouridine biosynthesis bifunctional protein
VVNTGEQVEWCDEFVANVPESIKEAVQLPEATATRWYPRAGWIEPRKFLAGLLESHACRFIPATTVSSWYRKNDQWSLRDEKGIEIVSVDALVVTTGVANSLGAYPFWMSVTPVRGQITTVNAADSPVPFLRCVLAERRYVIPGPGSSMTIGATFQPNDVDATCRGADDNHNLEVFSALWPNHNIPIARSSRVAWRAASLDYRPYVGAVPRVADYIQSYSALKHGNPRTPFPLAPYEYGVFVMLGFGSRGFTLAPLAAEILADTLAGLPHLAPRSVLHSLHPARHLIRSVRRGENVQVGLWSKDG